MVDEVAEHHQPILISGKRNDAVVISKKDGEAMQETLYLMSIPGMTESIQKAAAEPLEECVELEDLDW